MYDKIATIVPLAHLEELRYDDYLMALAHAAQTRDYMDFYKERAGEGRYVILDNSAVELGAPMDFATYLGLAMEMGASEIVLPDHFMDASATKKAAFPAIQMAKLGGYYGNIMFIPQGRNREEWYHNALWGMWNLPIQTLGLSCRYTEMWGNRMAMIREILPHTPETVKIHLLGNYLPPEDDVAIALRKPQVRGVDSSYASVFTKHDLLIESGVPRPADRNLDFITDRFANLGLFQANLKSWRVRCEYGRSYSASFGKETGSNPG